MIPEIENIKIRDRFTKTTLEYKKVLPPSMGKRLKDVKISVKRYFTNTDGRVIDKNTLPSNLQQSLPFFLFNEYDRRGGYFQSNKVSRVENQNWVYLTSCAGGDNLFRLFLGINNIQNYYQGGDLLQVWTDSKEVPNYYCWFVISLDSKSMASFTEFYPKVYVDGLRFSTDNDDNYYEPLKLLAIDEFGSPSDETQVPNTDLTPNNQNLLSVDVPLKWFLSTAAGVIGYFLFDTESISLSLKIKKQ